MRKWSGAGLQLVLLSWGCVVLTMSEKVCIGTEEKVSMSFTNFLDYYQGCTHILGNFEIREYNLRGVNTLEHFLRDIREITGHLLIYRVQGAQLTFPSLRVIRGQNLLRVHVDDPEYALLVVYSNIDRLEFPVMSEVSHGSVGLYFGRRMCNLENVDWKDIMSDKSSQFHYFTSYSNGTGLYGNQLEDRMNSSTGCEKCNSNCPNACWGEGADKCQSLSKVHCKSECGGGRCFGPGAGECCHISCVGGCSGPNRSDCVSCKGPYINGECQDACPLNKYLFASTCVHTCPSGTVVDEELRSCLATCPFNKYPQKGKCESVPPPGKLCRQASFSPWKNIHSGFIDNYKNCTILEGGIAITGQTFSGGSFQKNFTTLLVEQRVHPERLNVFRSLQEISGDLKIVGNEESEFINLTAFSSLEVIGSDQGDRRGRNVLVIDHTPLKRIDLKNLRRVYGNIVFRYNEELCYVDTIKWPNESGWEGNMFEFKDRSEDECAYEGQNCSSRCAENGCWGNQPEDCICPKYIWKGGRFSECPTGTYLSGCYCLECHENCRGGCGGPLGTMGDDGCKSCHLAILHVGGAIDCITNREGCPSGYFYDKANAKIREAFPEINFDLEAVCIPCHEYCDGECKGPSQELGELGCTSCQQEIDYGNGTIICMIKGVDCPRGFFLAISSSNGNELKQLVDKQICKRCDPRCSNCTGYGNQIHEMICQECTYYRKGDFCEEECPVGFYADVENHECAPCAEECRSCGGPTSLKCTACNFYYVYGIETLNNFENATGNFTCVMECPPELPLQLKGGPNKMYCEKALESAYWGNQLAVVGIALVLVGTLFGIGVQCCKQSRVRKIMEKVSKRESSEEISSSVEKFELPPNLNKFRTFDAKNLRKDEVLGRGAFGTVYKGIWMPEEDVKIPVAIKALHGTSDASDSRGFINEAFIMAGIQHPNLLSMLGLCLGSTGIMLVSQLMPLGSLLHYLKANKDSIGSKSMLNWCIQIATGMEHLESSRIIHRDLAARNVVMETPNSIKITDFGLAKLLNLSTEQYQGQGEMLPLKWLAPECFHGLSFSYKSDVWAFGVTVWEILTFGEVPFGDLPAEEVMATLDRGERLEQPDNCSIDMYLMLIKTWMPDPESRPSFKELVVDYSEMYQDPGRYLVIQNDELRRLPKYTLEDEQKLIRRLAGNWDRPEDVMTVEQYSRRDTKGYLLTESPASGCHYRDILRTLNYPSMYQYQMEKGLSESENI